eukprot:365282-Chlamydomonas_euryale.AAC.8
MRDASCMCQVEPDSLPISCSGVSTRPPSGGGGPAPLGARPRVPPAAGAQSRASPAPARLPGRRGQLGTSAGSPRHLSAATRRTGAVAP